MPSTTPSLRGVRQSVLTVAVFPAVARHWCWLDECQGRIGEERFDLRDPLLGLGCDVVVRSCIALRAGAVGRNPLRMVCPYAHVETSSAPRESRHSTHFVGCCKAERPPALFPQLSTLGAGGLSTVACPWASEARERCTDHLVSRFTLTSPRLRVYP